MRREPCIRRLIPTKGGVTAPLETADKRKNCLMRFAYQALYYPSSAEKIGQFSLPAVRMPYRALGSNLLRRFMQRTAFLPK
ncbi:inner membrane protein YeeA [Escherichia coli]|nr:inner membrane protein YeeA [Escherichia coli]